MFLNNDHYRALDGAVFDTSEKALEYEKRKIEKIVPLVQQKVNGLNCFKFAKIMCDYLNSEPDKEIIEELN